MPQEDSKKKNCRICSVLLTKINLVKKIMEKFLNIIRLIKKNTRKKLKNTIIIIILKIEKPFKKGILSI